MIHVTLYNLSVKLQTDETKTVDLIDRFLSLNYTLTSKGFGANSDTAKNKIFASRLKDSPTYYLHINQFRHFLHFAKQNNHDLANAVRLDKRDVELEQVNHNVREGWVLREHQLPVRDFILNGKTKSKLISMPTGSGKAQPLTSKIKIPSGWIDMGDVYEGCKIVTPCGDISKVSGVYPQGIKPVYRITFIDGRSCEATLDHLWKTYNKEAYRYEIVTTEKLIRLANRKDIVHYVDVVDADKSEDIDLPLHPYLLGALLGDGGFTGVSVKITKTDAQFIEKVRSLIPQTLEMVTQDGVRWSITNKVKGRNRGSLWEIIEPLGLRGLYSHEKFIPEIYMKGSYGQRLMLLQGLLDSDGSVSKQSGSLGYSTSSELLAKDFQQLVYSVGAVASIAKSYPQYTHNGEKKQGKPSYKFTIRHKDRKSLLTADVKLKNFEGFGERQGWLKMRVEKVEYIGEAQTQCISIEHPDQLYITDNYIPTHNTATSLIGLSNIHYKLGIVVLARFSSKWLLDLAGVYNVDTSAVMMIQGSSSLKAIISQAKEGKATCNYFIFNAETFQSYISNYEEDPEGCVASMGCAPIELFPLLGIGSLLMDEAHMSFHSLYKTVIHTNAKVHIGLSATFISDDQVVKNAHSVVFPPDTVYDAGELDKYTDVYALSYHVPPNLLRTIKTTNYGSNSYSHTAFEQSVSKQPLMLKLFCSLIDNTLRDFYIDKYEAKDKCLIFVATVKMATLLARRYAEMYPDKLVNRYCEEDPFENILEGEIVVTTVISAGTAIDIPDLRTVIQTVSISSSVANIQTLGRLRKLKGNKDTRFCYLYAENLPKQKQYHYKRLELFHGRVASHQCFRARAS